MIAKSNGSMVPRGNSARNTFFASGACAGERGASLEDHSKRLAAPSLGLQRGNGRLRVVIAAPQPDLGVGQSAFGQRPRLLPGWSLGFEGMVLSELHQSREY